MRIPISVLLILLAVVSVSKAAVYSYTDQQGNVIFTDIPHGQNSKVVTITEPIGIHSSVTAGQPSPNDNQKMMQHIEQVGQMAPKAVNAERPVYQTFLIISPSDKTTLQNPETIPVMVKTQPELFKTDKIQLLLDNKITGEAVHGTNLTLPRVERGEHRVAAIILDKDQRVMKQSNVITIFVQRANLNSPARVN